MCGRYALTAKETDIVSHFHLRAGFSMRPRFNISPSTPIPVITNQAPEQISFYRWGFLAAWVKQTNDLPQGHINARLESLAEKPSFKLAYERQRCLIPASGYFEWCTFNGKKQPFYIRLKTAPLMAFAGIWSAWRSSQHAEILFSCAIITIAAPLFLQKYHPRTPAIISPEKYQDWLEKREGTGDVASLLLDLTPENTWRFPVSPRVNHAAFEGEQCIQPL